MGAEMGFGAECGHGVADGGDFGFGVAGEFVQGDDDGEAEFLQVLDVAGEVDDAARHGGDVFGGEVAAGDAAVHLERADGGDDDGAGGGEVGLAAFDVEEFFAAEIGAEAGLGDDDFGEFERELGGDHRVAAMGDVGEGAAVDEGGGAFDGLHQVGHQGVAQQDGHGAVGLQVLRGDEAAVAAGGDDNAAEAGAQVVEVV